MQKGQYMRVLAAVRGSGANCNCFEEPQHIRWYRNARPHLTNSWCSVRCVEPPRPRGQLNNEWCDL